MWIVNLEANPNGSHNDHQADHITTVPDNWAMIPEDFAVPSSFPFVDIEATEVTHYREVEDEDTEGNLITEQRPYTLMTVISMTEKEVPETPEPEPVPTIEERVTANEDGIAALENALCEMDAANSEAIASIENALCELDM